MTNKTHIGQIDHFTVVAQNTTLTANQTFISTPASIGGYTHLTGFAYSDVSSALNGLIIEQAMSLADFPSNAPATTNITRSLFTVSANEIVTNNYSVQLVAPFVRIIYINGAAAQTSFRAFFDARILRGL